jgi:hypothetical protein
MGVMNDLCIIVYLSQLKLAGWELAGVQAVHAVQHFIQELDVTEIYLMLHPSDVL